MEDIKILKILRSMDSKCFEICDEVEIFTGNIISWADELEEMIEKEFSAKNQAFTFLLPKTPSEKRHHSKRKKNTLISECSAINSNPNSNGTVNLDNTMSTRSKAKRVLTSKEGQLNIPSDKQELEVGKVKIESEEVKNNTIGMSNETFVLPHATSTRTKPVVRNGNKNLTVSETTLQEDVENAGSQIPNDLLDTRPSRKKVSRLLSQSPVERQTRKKILNIQTETAPHNESKSIFSRTPSGSPVKHVSRKNASELSSSTPIEEQVRKKVSRALSESPIKRPSKFSRTFCRSTTTELSNITSKSPEVTTKSPQLRRSGLRVSRSPSQSPIVRRNEITVSKSGNTSPELRYSSLNDNKNPVKSPILRTRKDTSSVAKDAIIDNCQKQINSFGNKSIQYTLEETLRATKTYLLEKEEAENMNPEVDEEKTPKASGNGFTKITKTLTPSSARQKTILYDDKVNAVEEIRNQITKKSEEKYIPEKLSNSFSSLTAIGDKDENEFEVSRISKKKKKLKKDEKLEEVVDESAGNVRITRTKSKAIKEMLQENNIEIKQQQDLSEFVKKIMNKAKMTSQKKNKLAALLEGNETPKNGPRLPFNALHSRVSGSKTKYHLLSSSKKYKTPLATLPNSTVKLPKLSDYKDTLKVKVAKRDSSVENLVLSAAKSLRGVENEIQLKSKKKEDEAATKRQKVIKRKQEELKRKNELKQQMAMKQREKLELEKFNMIQTEKEKEEKHKLILQERQMKMKEEALRKKMLTQQKIAETIERRRLEEEARIAKLKETEAEEQRIALQKQMEQERQEKRQQARLALKKAREEHELQVKQELEMERLKAEKAAAAAAAAAAAKKAFSKTSKIQSASKRPKLGLASEKKEWDYKPRNENDYGLEDEYSEEEGEEENTYSTNKPAPAWCTKVMKRKCPLLKSLTLDMLNEYMGCHQKTPDISRIFDMSPTKKIKRTSSAIWNTTLT